MTYIVGSARIDERGKASGGKAGDQTGKEVCTQAYYRHKKGWKVLRANSSSVALKIAEGMKKACANPNIGYDQSQNQTLYKEVKNKGFDPSKASKKVETDCARLVRVVVRYAGVNVGDFYTKTERATLLGTGQFKDVTNKINLTTGKGLCIGDILVTPTTGHTVVVTQGDSRTIGGKVSQTVSKVATAVKTKTSKLVFSQNVMDYQLAYNACYSPDIGVDGYKGKQTIGSFANISIKRGTKGKAKMVKFIQRQVGLKGNDIDGIFGGTTERYVKLFQSSNGLDPDGWVGVNTISKMV